MHYELSTLSAESNLVSSAAILTCLEPRLHLQGKGVNRVGSGYKIEQITDVVGETGTTGFFPGKIKYGVRCERRHFPKNNKKRVPVLGTGGVQANIVRVPGKAVMNTIR